VAGRWPTHEHGLDRFRLVSGQDACVIQWPQSDMQRQTINVTDIEFEVEVAMLDLDAEYEALCAEYAVLV
jgi:hypothetical protein